MGKRYVYCIRCEVPKVRMVRTGKQELEYKRNEVKLYKREYQCPNCKGSDMFSEYKNCFVR